MSAGRGRVWLGFGLGAVALIAALAWITQTSLHLEAARQAATAEAEHAAALRTALWRIDSWLTPQLAREAELLTASPPGTATPLGQRFRWSARDGLAHALPDAAQQEALDAALRAADLPARLAAAQATSASLAQREPAADVRLDLQQRAQLSNRQIINPSPSRAGPLFPLWLGRDGADGDALLTLLRRTAAPTNAHYEGVLLGWPTLQEQLVDEVTDLFAGQAVRLAPLIDAPHGRPRARLAALPASLITGTAAAPPTRWTPTHTGLAVGWGALTVALLTLAWILRATLALAERRARFTAAVTHELRTPLTTFQLYTELLRRDELIDSAQRASYLRTLEQESQRLGKLVDDVLAYARIERGRSTEPTEDIELAEVLRDVTPLLRQRAAQAEMTWLSSGGDNARLRTRPQAIARILVALVDNACRYARGGGRVELQTLVDRDRVELRVRDWGPGIAAAEAREVFRPFARGAAATGNNQQPGLGLGLALARELAARLGGNLRLEPADSGGAVFALTLPRG
ncbi:MAG: HAMP domain-containing sensor histidine kinase [Planctomycetota bacterium]